MELVKPKEVQIDGELKISVGKSRHEKAWKVKTVKWSELVAKLSKPHYTHETLADYVKMTKEEQGRIKDIGGFVGGTIHGGQRKADSIKWRELVTLDADSITGDLWASVEMMADYSVACYSTHKHKSSAPRLRLVIPLSRPVTPEEYEAVARKIAEDFGMDNFDDTTYQPHRLMYWPSTSKDGEYFFDVIGDLPFLDPDHVLDRYDDWKDLSQWPESSRQKNRRRRTVDKAEDPTTKEGIIGAFCRVYSIEDAIDTFLSDIYEPVGDGRYTFVGGSAAGGLVIYDGGLFAYSHHSTDPICGMNVNAFDLVRIHLYGENDKEGELVTKQPSFAEMSKMAAEDANVKKELIESRAAEAGDDFGVYEEPDPDSWSSKILLKKNGKAVESIDNIVTIIESDPNLSGVIALNEFTGRVVMRKRPFWRVAKDGETWADRDSSELRRYIEKVYGVTHVGKTKDAFVAAASRHTFHPVREYLNGLVWDGTPRVDTLFIDYLGAEDSRYTRTITRKMLVAAVARVMVPGIKYDSVLVLVGPQGVGKSQILTKLGQDWFSDSFTAIQGREAYEQLQGAWIIEMAEMAALKKAEVESIKHFISKQSDSYRVAYGEHVQEFKRQCVFFGTANEDEFLRDKTGNRRFLPLRVDGSGLKDIWEELDDEVGQIWAEAVALFRAGEPLHLSSEMAREAAVIQEAHTEVNLKVGMVHEYLDTLLPDDWYTFTLEDRRRYLHGSEFGSAEKGTMPRTKVCAAEILAECFELDVTKISWHQALEMKVIVCNLKGWKASGKRMRFSLYGLQSCYVRNL